MDSRPGAPLPPRTILDRCPALTLGLLVALYLLLTITQAATRLLWADEVITVSIARQGLSGIWHALSAGADPNPPLIHLLVLASTRIFGLNAFAIRLPSIATMLLAIICLWLILRRWLTPSIAALGVLAFMATRGFDYSYDARAYAPLTGFTIAALLCWLKALPANESQQPRSTTSSIVNWTPLLIIALAAAVSSNYYGILAWIPIAVGEITFTVRTRRFHPAIWAAMAIAAIPIYFYLPLIHHNIAEFTPHAWNRTNISVLPDIYFILVEGIFWPVLFAALYLAWRTRRATHSTAPEPKPTALLRRPHAHELAPIAVLLAYPFLGLALSALGGGMISARCVLPVCCGFAIAAALLAARLVHKPRAIAILLAIAVIWVVARQSACFVLLQQQRSAFLQLIADITSAAGPTQSPILIADSNLALPLAWYAPPHIRARLIFPIDFPAIHQYETDDSGEQNLWAGRNGVFPFQIILYTSALAAAHPPLVLARPNGWLATLLASNGLPLHDETTPAELNALQHLGGVFTPLAHDRTRLLAP